MAMPRPVAQARSIKVEVIRLPDGREFLVSDLKVKPGSREHYNLRTGKVARNGRPKAIDRSGDK